MFSTRRKRSPWRRLARTFSSPTWASPLAARSVQKQHWHSKPAPAGSMPSPSKSRISSESAFNAGGKMSNTVYISAVIDAPVEEVWKIMRDYNGMPSYHPGIKHSLIEEGRPSDQLGSVRRLTLAEGFVREVLLGMDDRNYIFTYEIVEGTLPVRGYVAGVRLHRVTQGNLTFAEWWADFEVVGADRGSVVAQIGNNVFAAGFTAVAAKLAGKRSQ